MGKETVASSVNINVMKLVADRNMTALFAIDCLPQHCHWLFNVTDLSPQ